MVDILSDLRVIYTDAGFHQKSNYYFEKEIDEFLLGINFNEAAEYDNYWIFKPYFTITNKKVTKVIKEIFSSPDNYIPNLIEHQSHSLAEYYGNNALKEWIGYKINKRGDNKQVIEHHREFMSSIGKKFIIDMTKLDTFCKYINHPVYAYTSTSDIELKKFIRRFGLRKVIVGLIASHIKEPDDFNKVKEKYSKVFFPDRFQSVITQIDSFLRS